MCWGEWEECFREGGAVTLAQESTTQPDLVRLAEVHPDGRVVAGLYWPQANLPDESLTAEERRDLHRRCFPG